MKTIKATEIRKGDVIRYSGGEVHAEDVRLEDMGFDETDDPAEVMFVTVIHPPGGVIAATSFCPDQEVELVSRRGDRGHDARVLEAAQRQAEIHREALESLADGDNS